LFLRGFYFTPMDTTQIPSNPLISLLYRKIPVKWF